MQHFSYPIKHKIHSCLRAVKVKDEPGGKKLSLYLSSDLHLSKCKFWGFILINLWLC